MPRKKNGGKVSNEQLSLFESLEWFADDDIGTVQGEQQETVLSDERRGNPLSESHGTGGAGGKSGGGDHAGNHGEESPQAGCGQDMDGRRDGLQQSGSGTDERTAAGMDRQSGNHETRNYVIKGTDEKLTAEKKFDRNIEALRMLAAVERKGYASEEEQKILAGYTGWGGLPHVFNEGDSRWSERNRILREHVDEEQYRQARASTLDSFYTPYTVINKMYMMLEKLGFDGGYVLDPSAGIGNFFGLMPAEMAENSCRIGCELDETTGRIARFLYPEDRIDICGFQNLEIVNNSVDAAITNVPFGSYRVNDREYNSYGFSIHNYFFAKAIDKVHPGGLVMFITSTETMDGASRIREYMAERCDLVAAYRLPCSTFRMNGANTDVDSDIVILKKLDRKRILSERVPEWVERVRFEESETMINKYFAIHRNHILGNASIRTNQYGKPELTVLPHASRSLEELLDEAIAGLPEDIFQKDDVAEMIKETADGIEEVPIELKWTDYKNNSYFIEDGKLMYKRNSVCFRIKETEKDYLRIKGLVEIGELCQTMIKEQINGIDDSGFRILLEELNRKYDSFRKKFGNITSITNRRAFRDDSNFYLLNSLEIIEKNDDGRKHVEKSPFFFERTIQPHKKTLHCDTAADAYAAVMNEYGRLDVEEISRLIGRSREETIKELEKNNLVIKDHQSKEYVLMHEYLSGNVRRKLEEARGIKGYEKNAELLERVVPDWLSADQIAAHMGVPWLPADIMEDFFSYVFGLQDERFSRCSIIFNPIGGNWDIHFPSDRWKAEVAAVWGVPKSEGLGWQYSQPRYDGYDLFECIMNNGIPLIKDYWDEKDPATNETRRKSRINAERTAVARDKMQQMEEKWNEWIYADFERRGRVERIYNEKFNSFHTCPIDGSFLRCEGMNPAFRPEKYQLDTAARIIMGGNTLLDQVVGSGKTLEMIIAGMEMKRMGLKHNIMYVVPNSLVDQWASEFYRFYPNARILAASPDDFRKEKRNMFLHRFATDDYDAVIIPHSCFGKIPLSLETKRKNIRKQMEELDDAILVAEENQTGHSRKTSEIKNLERIRKSLESRIEKLNDMKQDDGLTFEQLGIDMLFVDEAHKFKNLLVVSRMTNIAGIPNVDSQKANDMYMKTSYLNEGNRGNVCFATGTPISNTMAELYNIHRYLQEDTLRDRLGIYSFDGWAKTFGKVVSSFEISVDGSSFNNRLRFCKFFNIPELMGIYREVACIMTKPQLQQIMAESGSKREGFKIPSYAGGKPQIVSNEPTEELEEFMADIVKRTEDIHNGNVDPSTDNMLLVTTESKRASIDLRLVGLKDEGIKLRNIISKVSLIYREYDMQKGTQLIFCDSSVPSADKWNVYDAIKDGLIAEGIPADTIAYIHDAKTDKQRAELFDRMRKGMKRILIGSTEKMGAGMNVQNRLIALHHVDVPWRASDIEQRNGRGFRQGNMFDEIYEFRYVTKKSFDAYSWQMIETKASYSAQLKESGNGIREMEEDSLAMFSYAEVKAIASGNPLIKEKMELDQEVAKLQRLKASFNKEKWDTEKKLRELPCRIADEEDRGSSYAQDLQHYSIQDIGKIDEWFRIKLRNKTFTNMKEANDFLHQIINGLQPHMNCEDIGEYFGFPLYLRYSFGGTWKLCAAGARYKYEPDEPVHSIGRTNWERLTRMLNKIQAKKEESDKKAEQYRMDIDTYRKALEKTFPHEEALREKQRRLNEVNELLSPANEINSVVFEEPDAGSQPEETEQIEL